MATDRRTTPSPRPKPSDAPKHPANILAIDIGGSKVKCLATGRAEPVDIPATLGYEGGVWFRIRQGVRGVLVHDEQGQPVAYMICEPASHYYEVMTRSKRMPVLIGERI